MTDLDVLIQFWTAYFEFRRHELQGHTIDRIEQTIKFLKELKELKGE